MNAERLHAIAIDVLNDINNTNIQSTLQNLVAALQRQISDPQNQSYQNQVSATLKTLYESLPKSRINDYSPAWKQALKELGLSDLLGVSLSNRIKGIFERNQITPATAQQELQSISKEFTSVKISLEQITSSFKILKIGAEELEPGQCEIGILIPRIAVNNKLRAFAEDLEDIDKVFGVFFELTTGTRPGVTIRSVSSSDLSVFFDMLPVVAASVAMAVERLVALYKNILEIRKLHGELLKQGITKKELQAVTKRANNIMERGIEKLVKELITTYYNNSDEGRRHELSIELKYSLNKIAKRIDRGYNVEVRVKPPVIEKEDIKKSEKARKDLIHIKNILSSQKNIEFKKLEGEPILSLPESIESKKTKKEKPKK